MRRTSFRKILFAVDRSPHSRSAALGVASLALSIGAKVLVTHVWNMEVGKREGKWDLEMPNEAGQLLQSVTDHLTKRGVEAQFELRTAPSDQVANEIVRAAEEFGADLVAVGSRGLSDMRGLFLGSVSHRVIARSDRPVLVIRHVGRRAGAPIRRILLAVAGGEEVPHGLAAARSIARRAGAEVRVLHARYLVTGGDALPFIDSEEDADRTVANIVRSLRKAGIKVATHSPVAPAGIPFAIEREARTWNADLIVIGSRRLSDLASVFLGALDHQVIHLSEQPVLIAQRPDHLVGSAAAPG